jgi:hypothetical protein
MANARAALRALPVILMAGVMACAGRTGGPEEVRRGGVARDALPGMAGRSCALASDPGGLPPFASLARIGTRGNIALWGTDLSVGDTVVLSVRYDDDGRLGWVQAIESSVGPEDALAVERLLLESLNETGPADWGVRLRLVGGDIVAMEPSVICPPEARRGLRRPVVPMATSNRDIRALEQARGIRYPIHISLAADGRITGVHLPRPSGDTVVDQFLMDWVFGTTFQPKLHDGIRMATVIEEHIYIPRRRR